VLLTDSTYKQTSPINENIKDYRLKWSTTLRFSAVRCTSFEGIVLETPIRKSHIWMDWRIVHLLTRFQYKEAEEALPAADKRALVLEAIRTGGELENVYLKPDDTKSRRRIRPVAIEMMEYRGKTFEGVRAYCHKRGETRTFRLDRMLEVSKV